MNNQTKKLIELIQEGKSAACKAALKSLNIAADLEKDIGTSIFFTREEAERKQVENEN